MPCCSVFVELPPQDEMATEVAERATNRKMILMYFIVLNFNGYEYSAEYLKQLASADF